MADRMEKQVVVRVPDDLYAALVADAEANGRTVAQSVRYHLTIHLRRAANGGCDE